MAYEGDYVLFREAWAATAAACVVMPYALPILALMSLMIADPAEQHRAAEKWLDESPVDMGAQGGDSKTPATASGGGGSDLAFLRGELKRLSKEIGEKDEWEGRSYTSFLEKVNDLDGQLEKLDHTRAATGDTLKCSATLFHVLAVLCAIVGNLLAIMAGMLLAARFTPAAPAWEAMIIRQVISMHKVLKTIFSKHWKMIMKVTAMIGIAGVAFNQFTQDMPFIKAMPGKVKPNLIEAGAIYDSTKVDIVDSPASQMNLGDMDSPIPEFGF
ncbi:hypothetical protein SAMN05444920_11336 [Nonomuraea solani]|uniref:Uncharacterized protein n=1 Tax=Nonomuraea solani TaxID=1144553 RepID=A0A1H6EQS5_9ACTN|nr:hypothetical protein [Nonomuraea solani]SEG99431.1 hypothetical protein SAMN05444920_11336 [Nonomuraea solani]